jgi:hypothetical protein
MGWRDSIQLLRRRFIVHENPPATFAAVERDRGGLVAAAPFSVTEG